MRRLSFAILLLTAAVGAFPSEAAELKVLSLPGIKAALEQIRQQYEAQSGNRVTVQYEIFAGQKENIGSGRFDAVIFAKPQVESLAKQNKVRSDSLRDIVRTSIGIAIKKGAPKPPMQTVDDFKRALLAAKSITYTKESATGVYVTDVLARLGLTEALKDKLVLQPAGNMTAPAVATGKVELGIVLISDIMQNPGAELAAALPAEIQNFVVQTAAVGSSSAGPKAASEFVDALASSQAASTFASAGLEPLR
jgi:molybdate transport system substrate-binding protein